MTKDDVKLQLATVALLGKLSILKSNPQDKKPRNLKEVIELYSNSPTPSLLEYIKHSAEIGGTLGFEATKRIISVEEYIELIDHADKKSSELKLENQISLRDIFEDKYVEIFTEYDFLIGIISHDLGALIWQNKKTQTTMNS